MIIYKHDEKGFTLTAYADGEPIAWLLETPQGWELHTFISIHTYTTFADLQRELEKLYG